VRQSSRWMARQRDAIFMLHVRLGSTRVRGLHSNPIGRRQPGDLAGRGPPRRRTSPASTPDKQENHGPWRGPHRWVKLGRRCRSPLPVALGALVVPEIKPSPPR
jgi:hypothetical protein